MTKPNPSTSRPTTDTHPMTTYESSLGRAIAILRAGGRLPFSLIADLREQGYDIPSLHEAHLNKMA